MMRRRRFRRRHNAIPGPAKAGHYIDAGYYIDVVSAFRRTCKSRIPSLESRLWQ
jgi:hypothetical protein